MNNIKIEHIGIWVKDLGIMKSFYEKYFFLKSGEKYHNPKKKFTSYFLGNGSTARIELMHLANDESYPEEPNTKLLSGIAHIAFSLGSKDAVDQLTSKLEKDGYKKLDGPRTTGDGYYESTFFDPENNKLELTI